MAHAGKVRLLQLVGPLGHEAAFHLVRRALPVHIGNGGDLERLDAGRPAQAQPIHIRRSTVQRSTRICMLFICF